MFEELSEEQILLIYRLKKKKKAAEVFAELDSDVQDLEKAFYPRTINEIIEKENNNYKYLDTQIRYMSNDIAVSSGQENDNSVCILGNLDLETGHKNVEYVTSINGMNSVEQVKLIKRLFYEYKCQYYVMDSKGIGNVIFDMLTVPTEDTELGVI